MGYGILQELAEPYKVVKYNPEKMVLETVGEFDDIREAKNYITELEERNDTDRERIFK